MSVTPQTTTEPKPDGRHQGLYAPAAAEPAVQERRSGVRQQSGLWASLVALDGREMIRCPADNVAEGGMHLTSPVGYGFAVGQRYEILLQREEDDGQQSNLLGEGHYATVVRTRFLMGGADRVGVGLRFDQPLVL